MDNLDQYNVAPPSNDYGPVQPYNTNAFVANQAQNFIRQNIPAAPPMNVAPPSLATAAPGATAPKAPTMWQAFLMKNGAKTPEDFDKARDKFRLALEAGLYNQKLTKDGVEATLRKFDAQAEEDRAALNLPSSATAGGKGEPKDNANMLSENIAAFGIGAAQVLPGVMSLGDLLYRDARGLLSSIASGKASDYNLGEKTALGQAADQVSGKLNAALIGRTSSETLAQQKDIEDRLRAKGVPESRLAGYVDTISEYLGHPRALLQQASGGASTFVPIAGTAKLLGGAAKLAKLGTAERVLRVGAPTGAAFAARAESEFEQRVRGTDINTILKDRPELEAVYNVMDRTPEAAKTIKQHIIDQGSAGVFASNFLANAALPAIPGFGGIERAAAAGGQRAVGRTVNALKTAGSEFAEESVAGGTQDISQNQVLGRPAFEGAGANAAISGLAGGIGGGVVGAVERTPSQTKKSLKKPAAGTTGAAAAPATAPGDIGATANVGPYANPAVTPLGETPFAKVLSDVDERLDRLKGTFKKKFAKAETPIQIIQGAEAIAQRTAGDAWITLSTEQRLSLVEKAVAAVNTKVSIDGVGEALASYKAQVLTPGAGVQPAPVQETPLPAGIEGEQVPNTVAPEAVAPTPAETLAPVASKTLGELTDDITTPTGKLAQGILALVVNTSNGKITVQQAQAMTVAQAQEILNPTIAPAPAVTPPVQTTTRGKLKREPVAEAAKAPADTETSKGRALYLDNYLKSILDKPNANDAENRADPRFNAARAAQSKGLIQNPTELAAFLDAEATRLGEIPRAQTGETDNRKVGKVRNGVGKANKKARDEVKAMMRVLTDTGAMTPTEMDNATVSELRASYAQAIKDGGIKPVEAPKAKPKKKGIKKAPAPNTAATTTPNDIENMPIGKTKERKTSGVKNTEGGPFDDARVSSLVAEDIPKGKKPTLRKAQTLATGLLENIDSERAKNDKGIPSNKKLGEMTLAQLQKFYDDLIYERSRSEAKSVPKKEEVSKEPSPLTNALGLVSDLSTDKAQSIVDKALTAAQVATLHSTLLEAVKSGKFSALQEALTKAGAYAEHIAKVVKQAKQERTDQLSRFEGFQDLSRGENGAPLTLAQRGKLLSVYLDYVDGKLSLTKFRKGVQDITNDVTGNGPEKILIETAAREKAAAEETPPPKTQAPLTEGADSKKPQSKKKAVTKSTPKLTVGQQISKLTELTAKQRADLTSAVELAQQGEDATLKELLQDNLDAELITKEQATDVRKLAATEPKTSPQLSREHLEELKAELEEATQNANLDESEELDMLDVVDDELLRMDTEENIETADEPVSAEVQRALDALEAELLSSDSALKALNLRAEPSVKGTDAIVGRLKELRRNPDLREAADFAIWLLEANPHVARVLGLTTRNMAKAGGYNPMQLMVYLNESKAKPRTVVHEILHHMERMMPYQLQQKIRAEYSARLANKLKQVTAAGRKNEIAYIQAVYESLRNPTPDNIKAVKDFITGNKVNADEFYKYSNPSEYWAETGSEILGRNYKPDSWIAELKEWVGQFIENLKQLLGWENEAAVYAGLKEVLEGKGKFRSNALVRSGPLAELNLEASEGKKRNTNIDDVTQPITKFQRTWEKLANNILGFEEFEIQLRKLGVNLSLAESPTGLASKYNSDVSRNNEIDMAQVSNPVKNWLADNHTRFDPNFSNFLSNLNVYFGNKHMLETLTRHWWESVPLDNYGKELERQDLQEAFDNEEISPDEFRKRMTALAANHAKVVNGRKMDVQDFAIDKGMSEEMFAAIGNTLDKLASEYHMTDEAMDELNDLLAPVRERQIQRMIESGSVSKNDRWIKAYGYKHYVPLKGTGKVTDAALGDFDFIPTDRIALAKLNQSVAVADGRTTFAEKPFERLFVDLARSGERSAWNSMAEGIYNIAADNQKLLKAKIEVWKGTPKGGYTNGETNADGDLKIHAKLPRPLDGIVYSDGEDHYVVRLPEHSQLLRGIKAMASVARPPTWVAAIGKGTSILGRAYTTLSPFWATAKGFIRDWTTIPITIAAENFDNPVEAGKFLLTYPVEMLKLYKALPTLLATVQGDTNEMLRMAEENPTGYAAKVKRYLDAGGANNFTEGFELAKSDKIFKQSYKTADGIWEGAKLAGSDVFKYTGNWANFLENMTRVAAHEALMQSTGTDATDAALRVRRVLDYAKTGTWGRNINAFTAFYRTGMTSADTFRRAFRKPLGGTDWKKLGIWTATLSAISMAAYFVVGASMGDDEEKDDKGNPILDENGNPVRVPRMNKIKASTLTQKMFVPIGDKTYGVELGLGFPQVLMAPGVLGAAVANGHITMGEAAGEMWNVINRNGPARLAGMRGGITTIGDDPTNFLAATILSLTPTLAAPLLAKDRNLNAFDTPIHRENYDKNKPKYGQAQASTPKEFIDASRWLYENSGVDMFPEDLKFLASNYGGQNVSDLFKATLDVAHKNTLGEDAYYNVATDRFEIKDLDYYDQNDMYDTTDAIGLIKKKYAAARTNAILDGKSESEAESIATRMLNANPADAAAIKAADAIKKAITARGKELHKLSTDSTLSPTRKQLMRKKLDSDLRKLTLKARYLLEKAQ